MTERMMEAAELRRKGFDALVNSLGWANAVRFIQQYESSILDYTAERDRVLPDWNVQTIVDRINKTSAETE
jgi:hypothetical protein